MANKQYVEKIREHLYGENKNFVEAAFILDKLSKEYGNFRGSRLTSDYWGLRSSFEKIGSNSLDLLKKLRTNNVPSEEELSKLEKNFDQLEKDEQEDNRMYGALRNRRSYEISEQEFRDGPNRC